MADNIAFNFTGDIVSISIPTSDGKKKKGEAGVYHAIGEIERSDGQGIPEKDSKFVRHSKDSKYLVDLTALEERLDPKNENQRKADYENQCKADRDPKAPQAFELWSMDGTLNAVPRYLIPTNKVYNDAVQLLRWADFANHLGGKPPININPAYARFILKPSDALKKEITVYFTPCEEPVCKVDVAKLKDIIEANKHRFEDWPKHEVLKFSTAKKRGYKAVSTNFFKFYVTWMEPKDYVDLWKERDVAALPLAFPIESDELGEMNKKVNKSKRTLDGTVIHVTSKKIQAARGNREGKTDTIMGTSATPVVAALWKLDPPTTRMGKWKSEWLHRSACALGGLNEQVSLATSNDPGNLVFGTWECNTDMIRAENMITETTLSTKGHDKGAKYAGKLTTTNKLSGNVTRRELSLKDSSADIPAWFETGREKGEYSWLCFQLDYKYIMPAETSPLGCTLNATTTFEPLSLYVPLHIEPRLDIMVLTSLKDDRDPAKISKTASASPSTSHRLDSGVVSNPSPSIPPLPLPDLDLQTAPILAWRAAMVGLPSLELPGLVISHPTIAQPQYSPGASRAAHPVIVRRGAADTVAHDTPLQQKAASDTVPPKEGFVLQGGVKLFNSALVGQLEKWMGPSPKDVVVGIEPPCIERVKLPGDFHMSMVLPLLKGTPFDDISFQNVVFYRQNYAFDKTKTVGWHFNADWVIEPSCGLLYDILTRVLQVDRLTLSMYASLGEQQGWNDPLSLHSFTFEGVFVNLTFSSIPGLRLTSIGIRLLGIRGFTFSPEPHSTLSYGFNIFGTMKLDVPGSILPLDLNYEMGVAGTTVNLSAEIIGQIWENALGVQNLVLEDLLFTTSFSASSPWKSFAFDVSATFWSLSSQVSLAGSYTSGGHFSLKAEFDDFGTEEIDSIFITLFSNSLTLPNFDVHIGSAILSIVSGEGLSMSLLNVDIAGHTALDVNIAFTTSGASLSGALSSKMISFGEVGFRDAVFQVTLWSSNKKKQADLILGGTLAVDFLDTKVKAAAHLYPGQGEVAWAVLAELTSAQRSFSISDIVHDIKYSFLDLSLKNALFIAASRDDLPINQSFPEYRIRQGVQILGVIDRISPLNVLLNEDVSGLVLSAGWSKASGFSLSVSLPAASSLDLGNGIRTTPISLVIRTKPVELAVIAGLTVSVKDSTPLDFSFVLAANATGASASPEVKGWWVKPFGIDNVKIGSTILLSVEIIYAQFVSTGTPSGFGLAGGLMIGSVEAQMALNVSEEPRRQMLSAMVKKLDISDVVTFARDLVQQEIPEIPTNFLRFEELRVYICPFGIVLGTTSYPQGFSFKADMMFLEKRANIECQIDQAQKSIDIVGGIDDFELGPLSLRGSHGPRAEVECHIGVSKQQLAIDGVVSLFDLQAQTSVHVQFLPNPIFKFYVLLEFAKIFMFKLDAKLIGSLGGNLHDSDFSLDAKLQNDILDYIAQQVIEQFEAAKASANKGLEAAQEQVKAAKKAWKAAIAGAEKKVDAAREGWESYKEKIRSSSQPVIDNYLFEISRLQNNIENARKAFESALQDAKTAVEQANRDRGAALAAANRDVEQAKRDMDNGINGAQRALDYASADLSNAFGNAQRAIDSAQREVWSLQNQINDVKGTIREYEKAPWYEFWKKGAIAGLWAAVGGLEASKAVASGVLDGARAVLQGTEYLSKEGAVRAARFALEAARETGRISLSAAQGALTAADETSKFAVDRANDTLTGVQKGTAFVAFQGAIQALETFKDANKATYNMAVTAIEGLADCAALAAFTMAKVGLEVAKNSTTLLDGANEALVLAKKATEAVLSILQEITRLSATALDIKTVILSGTIRGVLGIGGEKSRPLSAAVTGYLLGNRFDFKLKFDPKDVVAFIISIFNELWGIITNSDSNGFKVPKKEEESNPKKEEQRAASSSASAHQSQAHTLTLSDVVHNHAQHFTLARKRLTQAQAQVASEAIDNSMPVSIPCSPFTGIPMLSSHTIVEFVDRMAREDSSEVKRFNRVRF